MPRSFLDFFLHAALVVSAIVAGVLLLFYEVYQAYPVPIRYYLWFGVGWTVLFLCRWRFRLTRRLGAYLLIAIVTLATFHLVPWNPRKPFLREFLRIEPGMSPSEVRAIMQGFRHSESGSRWIIVPAENRRFDSDWGEVDFKDGVVSEARFSAD